MVKKYITLRVNEGEWEVQAARDGMNEPQGKERSIGKRGRGTGPVLYVTDGSYTPREDSMT